MTEFFLIQIVGGGVISTPIADIFTAHDTVTALNRESAERGKSAVYIVIPCPPDYFKHDASALDPALLVGATLDNQPSVWLSDTNTRQDWR